MNVRNARRRNPKSAVTLNSSGSLSRVGITVPTGLLQSFNQMIAVKGYPSRSEAFRDLIRDCLITERVGDPDREVVGTLTLVYNHRVRKLSNRLVGMQHNHFTQIISTMHVHMDPNNCLEVIVLRGKVAAIQHIADSLIATRGIRHGKLSLTTAIHAESEGAETESPS